VLLEDLVGKVLLIKARLTNQLFILNLTDELGKSEMFYYQNIWRSSN